MKIKVTTTLTVTDDDHTEEGSWSGGSQTPEEETVNALDMGADNLCALRTLWLNGDWEEY